MKLYEIPNATLKKLRLKSWPEDHYIILESEGIYHNKYAYDIIFNFIDILYSDDWEEYVEETELSKAVELLRTELKFNNGYYMTWKANIAMAFIDVFSNYGLSKPNPFNVDVHQLANTAADKFLYMLINDGSKK